MRPITPAILLILLARWLPSVSAQPPAVIWGLSEGDQFNVTQNHSRTTQLSIENREPVIVRSSDRLSMTYRLERVSSNGDAHFRITIVNAQRDHADVRSLETPESTLSNLGKYPVRIIVEPDGHVRVESAEMHQGLLQHLAGNDRSILKYLKRSCPEEIYSSWFGRPFLIPQQEQLNSDAEPWDVSFTDSVGSSGIVEWNMTWQAGQDDSGQVAASMRQGSGRFLPLVLPADSDFTDDAPAAPALQLRIERTSVSGKTVNKRLPLRQPVQQLKPPFDAMLISTLLAGEATLDGAAAQRLGAKTAAFEHTHECVLVIDGFRFRANDRLQQIAPRGLQQRPPIPAPPN